MKKIFKNISLAATVWFFLFCVQTCRVMERGNELQDVRENLETLLSTTESYKVNDSLNAVSVGELRLTLEEYKQYRASDYEIIKQLKLDNKRLQSVSNVKTKTTYQINVGLRDTIIIRDSVTYENYKCFKENSEWYVIDGCVSDSVFSGTFTSFDKLTYIEHIIPKKWLFFKWGCKYRKQEIISKNPNTEIVSAEFISVLD